MTQSRIQVVFFDAADTLFHIHGSVADIYLQYAEKHGFKKTGESLGAIKAAFGRAFRDAPPPVFAATEPIGDQAIGTFVVVRHRPQRVLSCRDVRGFR